MASLTHARRLLQLGINVIPIVKGTKIPAQPWAQYQVQRVTESEISDWFSGDRHTHAVVTGEISGIVVIDCDDQEAEEWANVHLPATPLKVRTRKGMHRYYRHPGSRVANRVRFEFDGNSIAIDVRGDGGLTMGPGAIHESGSIYMPIGWREVFADGGPGWECVPTYDPTWLPQAPQWVPKPRPSSPTHTEGRPDAIVRARAFCESVGGIGTGGRNHACFKVSLAVAQGFELDIPEGLELVRTWNLRNDPPLPDREVEAVWRSACQTQVADRGWLLCEDRDVPARPHPEDFQGSTPAEIKPEPQEPTAQTFSEKLASETATQERNALCAASVDSDRVVLIAELEESDLQDGLAIEWLIAIRAILGDGIKIGPSLVQRRLWQMGRPEAAERFREQSDSFAHPDPVELGQWIEDLKANACRRRLARTAADIERLARDPRNGLITLRDSVPALISKAFRGGGGFGSQTIGSVALELAQDMESEAVRRERGETTSVRPFGFEKLDYFCDGGALPGEFILLVGPSSGGKSALALQIAGSWAKHGPVFVWSGEMSKKLLAMRRACQVLGKTKRTLTAGDLLHYEAEFPERISLSDQKKTTIDGFLTELRLFKLANPDCSGAVIDYLGLLVANHFDRQSSLADISNKVKIAAQEIEIPILGLYMQGNEAEKRIDKRPVQNDLRDNKQLIYDCDRMLMLYAASKTMTELWIRKNRNDRNDVAVSLENQLDRFRFVDAPPPKKRSEQQVLDGIKPEEIPF